MKKIFSLLLVFWINFLLSQTIISPKDELHYRNCQIFIKIIPKGNFKVSINDQIIENSLGKFRFFDFQQGEKFLSIWKNETLIYKTKFFTKNNTRIFAIFDENQHHFLLTKKIKIDKENIDWNSLKPFDFSLFLNEFKKQSFDKDKIDFLNSHLKNLFLSTQQIVLLVRNTSFDQNKLSIAEITYQQCLDKENYYLLEKEFSFDSDVEKLRNFIKKF